MRELGDGAMMGMLAMLASSGMARAPPHLLPPPLRSSSFSAACRAAPAPIGPARAPPPSCSGSFAGSSPAPKTRTTSRPSSSAAGLSAAATRRGGCSCPCCALKVVPVLYWPVPTLVAVEHDDGSSRVCAWMWLGGEQRTTMEVPAVL